MACGKFLTAGLDPACDAFRKDGGVNKRVWIGVISDRTGYTIDPTTKELKTYVQDAGAALVTINGKKLTNSGNYEVAVSDFGNRRNQNVILKLFHKTQLEREAIEGLIDEEEAVVFLQTNAGQIEVYGLDNGLKISAGSGGTGTKFEDDTSFNITLSGTEKKLPIICGFGADLAANIAYLDALTVVTP